MHTHVYANDEEIACKAVGNDGVSPQAFPDPCWSPPGPPAGPVVIPYPNTCFAGSISNGTSTVFICGKEIAIEDHSFFSTSTGNEPATNAFPKGVATGVITGKAYFTQWSFDVVFEGFGVPRHTDLVSHNHGSQPGNTVLFPYISRGFFTSFPCKKEEKAIERECGPEKDMSESKREIRGKSSLLEKLRTKKNSILRTGKRDKDGWHWTDDHCHGLEIPVGTKKGAAAYIKDMEKVMDELPKELDVLNMMKSELQDMVVHAAGRAAGKWVVKTGLKQAAGSTVPLAGNVLMGLWSVYDAGTSIADVLEIKKVAGETLEKLKYLQDKLPELNKMRDDFSNFKNLSPAEQEDAAIKLAADGQDMLATLNDCVRARKCNLVPYGAATNVPPNRDVNHEATKTGGCCFGQTGHHLLPEKSLEGVCPNYKHAAAPTVCAEGTSQNAGSHQRAHVALARQHVALAQDKKIASDGSMSMSDALNAGAKSHQEAFPLSKCSYKCIRAQLAAYYNEVCGGNARPKMMDAQAKVADPATVPGPDIN